MSISPSQIKNGIALMFKGEPYIVTEFQHVNPGKGSSFVRTKMRNIKNGRSLENTFKTSETIEEANVQFKRMNYLYSDGTDFNFMDEEFEQYAMPADVVGKRRDFLIEEARVDGVFLDGELVEINLPRKMDFKVISAPPGIKGDSASSATKAVEIETGATINVPLFIKEGEVIRINTENGEYCERVNQ